MIKNTDAIFDDDQVLKDGKVYRVRMTARDHRTTDDRTADRTKIFTDGGKNNPGAGSRPGWRVPMFSDRSIQDNTRRRADIGAARAWRLTSDQAQCSACLGSGEDDEGEECSRCEGSGVVSKGSTNFGSTNEAPPDPASDRRTVDERAQSYRDYDQRISDAWRG